MNILSKILLALCVIAVLSVCIMVYTHPSRTNPSKEEVVPDTPSLSPPPPKVEALDLNDYKIDLSTCKIKGNISYNTNEKIYHTPDQEFYESTTINEDYGERWFCSEQDAVDAGWRKSEQ